MRNNLLPHNIFGCACVSKANTRLSHIYLLLLFLFPPYLLPQYLDYIRGLQTYFCEGQIICPFFIVGPGRSVTEHYMGRSDYPYFYYDFKCIYYARLVYYFVMHRTSVHIKGYIAY